MKMVSFVIFNTVPHTN